MDLPYSQRAPLSGFRGILHVYNPLKVELFCPGDTLDNALAVSGVSGAKT